MVLLPSLALAQAPGRPQAEDDEVPPQKQPARTVTATSPPRTDRVPFGPGPEPPLVQVPEPDRPTRIPQPTLARPPAAVEGVRGGERDPIEDLLVRSQKGVTVGTMIDELLDELVAQLKKEDPKPLSPMAVRAVRLSPNLRPALGQALEAKLVARVGKLPNFEQVVCLECRTVRSRVEGDDWVVTFGTSTQADLRRVAADIGAKTFMEVDLNFNQVPAELTLAARIYRASDGHILFTTAIKGDETTAAILRTGQVPPSREEQLAELKRKMEQRPYFGYMVFLGTMYLGADGPLGGYMGANIGVRLFERFGWQRRHMYGIQGEGFLDWASNHALFSGIISAGYWFSILQPNLNRPDLRVGATLGGIISGTDGNSAVIQIMAEYVLQFRLAANLSALYMVPAKFTQNGTEDLGGFGFAARIAFNW